MNKNVFYAIFAFAGLSIFGFAATPVLAQLSITEVSSANNLGEDWYELTNTSQTTVNLNEFFWDDDGPNGNDGAIFGEFLLEPGESLIVLEGSELEDGIATNLRNVFGLNPSIQILTEDDFTGNDRFSGLSSNGDQISLYDTDPNVAGAVFNLIDFVEFPAAPVEDVDPTFGATFDFTQLDANNSPTLSVSGVNGSIAATNGDVGSPGFASIASTTPTPLLGDINKDGAVSFSDISPFIAILSAGTSQAEADIDMNGEVNFLDIAPFIAILSGS